MARGFLLFILAFTLSCTQSPESVATENTLDSIQKSAAEEEAFLNRLNLHLNAISSKNLESLKETLSPDGDMILILPQSEPTFAAKDFLDMHETWFQDSTWTFETKILKHEIAGNLGIAIVDVMYKEPDRNGKPYFNHMIISYGLRKMGDQWYVVKDHASSIEKTPS